MARSVAVRRAVKLERRAVQASSEQHAALEEWHSCRSAAPQVMHFWVHAAAAVQRCKWRCSMTWAAHASVLRPMLLAAGARGAHNAAQLPGQSWANVSVTQQLHRVCAPAGGRCWHKWPHDIVLSCSTRCRQAGPPERPWSGSRDNDLLRTLSGDLVVRNLYCSRLVRLQPVPRGTPA